MACTKLMYLYDPITYENAAALQVAIWEIVDASVVGGSFSINSYDYGASTMIAWLNANPDAAAADLIGLTGAGQDYVVQRVPDGGTSVVLLGLSFVGLLGLRRKLRTS